MRFACSALVCGLFMSTLLFAGETYTWTGGSGLWNDPTNWTGGNAGEYPQSGDIARLEPTTGAVITLSEAAVCEALSIESNNYVALIGMQLALESGNLTDTAAATMMSMPHEIGCDVVLEAQGIWMVQGTGSGLRITGRISGSFGFTKTGSSMLELTNNNTFTSASTVSAGTLRIANVSGACFSVPITVANSTLDLASAESRIDGAVTVGIGGVLRGLGRVAANVTVLSSGMLEGPAFIDGSIGIESGGVLSPGGLAWGSQIVCSGDVTIADGASLQFEIGMNPGYVDRVTCHDLSIAGGLQVLAGADFGGGLWQIFSVSGTETDNGLTLDAAPINRNVSIVPATDDQAVYVRVQTTALGINTGVADGVYDAGALLDFRIYFSDPVEVSGTPEFEFETGATDGRAYYYSGAGTNTLVFRLQVQAGYQSADLDYSSATPALFGVHTRGVPVEVALPAPGSVGSISAERDIILDGSQPVDGGGQTSGGSSPSGNTPTSTNTAPPKTNTIVKAVALSTIAPNFGTTVGGAAVTLTGRNFSANASVLFGDMPARDVMLLDTMRLQVTVPRHAHGSVDVIYVDENGASATLKNAYRYDDPPAISSPVVAQPAVAAINAAVRVTVGAADPDGGKISLLWNYGDGTADALGEHHYQTAGTFTVSVKITDGTYSITGSTVVVVMAGAEAKATPAMTVLSLNGTASNGKSGADQCKLVVLLENLPIDFDLAREAVKVDIAGAQKLFNLDSHGRGIGLKAKGTRRNSLQVQAAFKGSFRAVWQNGGYDLTDDDSPKTIPVTMTIDGHEFLNQIVIKTTKSRAAAKFSFRR